ncbi:cytochrome d ubiquinol oxidase, subunit II [Acididesulfobacillus acetoxydans]|uniref:Cytochrome d ubiquinol oxidase subunit 2 n=1 Tax=Acididesulfobacillus acetoxydans TaxID=1561005 RepID=A0A8S0WZV1_9FIRM|nr:cytochrome d ubiquinol oxidase subunit II [Acididesulfobacillus acetoxydans]CAA7602181.1 cytochrome d ubiquinol oxidase, subunit II [Acididesulfobacillus acetoxydans]CEJ08737.1 Cytochrome d ubiquinol oxidase subunit 2 [Acididesulfobacillus acetoxydans]
MDLNTLWFILIAVLFTGFFFLEGFDYGVGVLLPFLGRTDDERRVLTNSIGPVWDGNEVWLITAGGAIFAAFPNWYATLFSGFYLALALMLIALIVRGVSFEFRSSHEGVIWRKLWDWLLFGGSLVTALLWGVAVADLVHGVPINSALQYAGGFWDLLSLYSLTGGLALLFLFIYHGALYLSLKTETSLLERAQGAAKVTGLATILLVLVFALLTYLQTDLFTRGGAGFVLILSALALILSYAAVRRGRSGWAFVFNALTILFLTASVFWGLFPRVMVSSLRPQWSLTIYNAASSPYTLRIMTIVALILVPFVLLYQGWTYWVFRRRVNFKNLHY